MGAFVHQASDWKSLAAMMAGGMAYRAGRMGMAGLGSGNLIRTASVGLGLTAEVSAFELTHRGLTSKFEIRNSKSEVSNLWRWSGNGGLRQGLLASLITFGTLKGAGRLGTGQNLLVQHLFQDSAMVLGHQGSAALGWAPRPKGSLAEQFLHAEATNLTLGTGMSLAHRMAPGILALERGLDLSLGRAEIPSGFPDGKADGLAWASASAAPTAGPAEKTPFRPTILAMSKLDDSGASGEKQEKTIWLNPSEGVGADLQVFDPQKTVEPLPIKELTEEWRSIFERGGRILPMGGGSRLVGFSSELAPVPDEGVARAYEAWQAAYGFTKPDFETTRKAWEDLFGRLKRSGLALSYELKGNAKFPSSLEEFRDSPWILHGGPLAFLSELVALLPEGILTLRSGRSPIFQEVRWLLDSSSPLGSDLSLCNSYHEGTLYLPASLLKGSRSRLAEWFLHGVGHGVARYFREDRRMHAAYEDIVKGHTLWGLRWGDKPELRTRRQRADFSEFIVENFLGYVMASSMMRDYAKYSPTPVAWDHVYHKFRRLFDGWEYEYGRDPAEKSERAFLASPEAQAEAERLQMRGGVLARWLIDLIPSVGFIGEVARIDESSVLLVQVFRKKNGTDEELGKEVEIEGAQIRGSQPLKRGDRVHYLPPVAGGSGESGEAPKINGGGPSVPPVTSRFYSQGEANAHFFRLGEDWMKTEVIPRLGTDWGQRWILDEALFEPLGLGERLSSREIREQLSQIRRLPPELRRVMEFTLPVNPGEMILEYVVLLHQEFSRMGLHLYGRDEDGNYRVRLPSLPLLEVFLKSRFGDQALSFLYDRGETPEEEAVGFLRRGARTVGLASERILLNGRRVHPFPYALHDLYHIVRFSAAIPIWMRVAAALYYEAHRDYLRKMDPSEGIRYHSKAQMARIADLGLYFDFKLAPLISHYVLDMRTDLRLAPKDRHLALETILTMYLHKIFENIAEFHHSGIISHRRVLRNIMDSLFPPSAPILTPVLPSETPDGPFH